MKFYLGCVVFGALIALALSTPCHDDSQCTNSMTCSVAGEVPGCSHDVCTCVTAPKSCLVAADCMPAPGDHHQECHGHNKGWHCIDAGCMCVEIHP